MTRLVLAGLAGFLAVWTAHASPPAAPTIEVSIANYQFVPATLNIAAGTTITWVNNDEDVHTVMDAAGAFRSGALDQGQNYRYTFAKAGVYRIACSMHPQMSMVIDVR
jgi:plastocyanin